MIFSGISWKDYLIGAIILLTIYYFLLGIRYYRKEIKGLFTGKGVRTKKESSVGTFSRKYHSKSESEHLFGQTKELTGRITTTIQIAHSQNYPKYQLISLIKSLIRDYSEIKSPAITRAVKNAIIAESSKYELYNFKEEELGELWDE
ncbi:MAG: hypothetical protein ACRDE2_17830 [Chitinophagaceae bacterium]